VTKNKYFDFPAALTSIHEYILVFSYIEKIFLTKKLCAPQDYLTKT